MQKILGVLAAVLLLVCATAVSAEPQEATDTGNPSTLQTTTGSEITIFGNGAGVAISDGDIGVQVVDLATADGSDLIVTILAGDIGVIFDQIAIFNGSCETIEVGCGNLALFMGSDIVVIFDQTAFIHTEKSNAVTTAGDIELWMNRVAAADGDEIFVSIHQVANFNGPATKALEVSEMFDSAISMCFNSANLAIFMENTEVDQLLKGPRSVAVIHGPRSMMHC